jgi:hypothetical protein
MMKKLLAWLASIFLKNSVNQNKIESLTKFFVDVIDSSNFTQYKFGRKFFVFRAGNVIVVKSNRAATDEDVYQEFPNSKAALEFLLNHVQNSD